MGVPETVKNGGPVLIEDEGDSAHEQLVTEDFI